MPLFREHFQIRQYAFRDQRGKVEMTLLSRRTCPLYIIRKKIIILKPSADTALIRAISIGIEDFSTIFVFVGSLVRRRRSEKRM